MEEVSAIVKSLVYVCGTVDVLLFHWHYCMVDHSVVYFD